jgi:hypothetical protein
LNPRAVVLVEGMSDQAAVETLAHRRGRDLVAKNVAVVAMGGATNLGHFLERFGPSGIDVKLAGLCDAAEEDGNARLWLSAVFRDSRRNEGAHSKRSCVVFWAPFPVGKSATAVSWLRS